MSEASPSRLRVLLIAEACNPDWVSVPLEGWSHGRAIASLADVHLVTQVRNREAILRAGLTEGKDFTAIDSESISGPAYRLAGLLRGGAGKGWTTVAGLSALAYPYFEHLIWGQFGGRIRRGEWAIVHRLTPLSPTAPSMLAAHCRRAGVPFVLGPLNGGVPWPREFDAARHEEKEWLSYIRNAYKLLPGYRATRANAAAILVGSRDTWEQMPRWSRSKCVYVPENGIDPARFAPRRTPPTALPIRAAFVGRLVPYKGADMLIEAAAPLVRAGKLVLEIIGDGPQMPELKQMVRREQIDGGVKLPGWVEHRALQGRLQEADVFTFPSIREFGGAVVLEAMALGVVPIVVDYGGPGELVTERTGFCVPIGSRQQIVSRFRSILTSLADDPRQIELRAEPAIRRARSLFTWEAKARQVLEVYRWVLNPSLAKPDFGMPLPDGPT